MECLFFLAGTYGFEGVESPLFYLIRLVDSCISSRFYKKRPLSCGIPFLEGEVISEILI